MNKKHVADFVERVGATFLQAFISAAIASAWIPHFTDTDAAYVALGAGALAAAKFIQVKLGQFLGS